MDTSKLNSEIFEEPYEIIDEICQREKKISDDLLNQILSLTDKLVIGDFLEKFDFFSKKQLQYMSKYVCKNLKDSDELFVSDLINFANKWHLKLCYKSILGFLNNPGIDPSVILSSIFYLYENLVSSYKEEVIDSFKKVIRSKKYYQNCQVACSFYLLILSDDQGYIRLIKNLIADGQDFNKELLKNILKFHSNQDDNFKYYNDLIKLISV
ncbi:hypothetical protein QQ008_27885 [Fulvivirgaceae bacterium BMA10]|uniref:Uncharacterized protein n=1 Tax=Splendidivirga corallicola TaxID=3051826 RepID=A0ABT8KWP8_9BACT|nr:hypothetical protein [Fulvivirgaceae bacterium BMA10]